MADLRQTLEARVTEATRLYFTGTGTMKALLAARNALAEHEARVSAEAVRAAEARAHPVQWPKLTNAEIRAELDRRAPAPPTITLSARERAALAAYRKARQAWEQARDRFVAGDPYTASWMD